MRSTRSRPAEKKLDHSGCTKSILASFFSKEDGFIEAPVHCKEKLQRVGFEFRGLADGVPQVLTQTQIRSIPEGYTYLSESLQEEGTDEFKVTITGTKEGYKV